MFRSGGASRGSAGEPRSGRSDIDLGGVPPIVLSDGTVIDLPRTTTADRKRLANAQRVLARRANGSRNWAKARRRVARLQARYARRRKDAVHKATTMIAKEHGVIVIEHLKVAAMIKSGSATVENPGKLVQRQGELQRHAARRVAADDPDHAGVQGAVARLPYHRRRSCADLAVLQRLRHRRRREPRISRSRFVCTNCGSIFDACG